MKLKTLRDKMGIFGFTVFMIAIDLQHLNDAHLGSSKYGSRGHRHG